MQSEEEFLKSVIRIKALAKEQKGVLSREQVVEHFGELSDSQMKLLYDFFKEEKISVSDNVPLTSDDGEPVSALSLYLSELNDRKSQDHDDRLKEIEKIMRDTKKWDDLSLLFLNDVVDIARLYEGQGVYREDLIGEGNVALMLACRMAEYAESPEEVESIFTEQIMNAMESLIMENTKDDGMDVRILEKANDLLEKAKELSETLMRKVTPSEIAKEYELDVSDVNETIRLSGNEIEYIDYSKGSNEDEA